MDKKDIVGKDYFGDAKVFADVFNFYLYNGEQVISPESLSGDESELVTSLGMETDVEVVQKYRDLMRQAKVMKAGETTYLLLGLENQAKVNYLMPVRGMLYDSLQYRKQTTKFDSPLDGIVERAKALKLTPVVTLVLYLGAEPWDGPRSIHDMLASDYEDLKDYIADYKLNLIVPREMDDDVFEQFGSSLGKVLKFIKYSKDRDAVKYMMKTDSSYSHMDRKAVILLNEVTNAKIEIHNDEEEIDMCKAFYDMKMEGVEEGLAEGRAEGIQALVDTLKDFLDTPEQIWSKIIKNVSYANVTLDDVMKYY